MTEANPKNSSFIIRKAEPKDLDAIERIYNAIHDQEEAGIITIGWNRSIYPTRATAQAALDAGDMFVIVDSSLSECADGGADGGASAGESASAGTSESAGAGAGTNEKAGAGAGTNESAGAGAGTNENEGSDGGADGGASAGESASAGTSESAGAGADEGRVVAAARINQEQVPEYANCAWNEDAPTDEVMVLHTLVVDPTLGGRGYGKKFVSFYEAYALEHGCRYLRMDTNARNVRARAMYAKLGYVEPGIVPCVFNGIEGVQLVCLEKTL